MPEVLSQSQIDALLKGMSSGDVVVEPESNEKKIKDYDFYSPKKFTKEQLRNVDSIHENIARLFSSYFSGSMRICTVFCHRPFTLCRTNSTCPAFAFGISYKSTKLAPHKKNDISAASNPICVLLFGIVAVISVSICSAVRHSMSFTGTGLME